MPVEIGEMHSDVTVMDGDLPLNERQIEKLVQLVCKHLEKQKQETERSREATTLRRGNVRPARVGQ